MDRKDELILQQLETIRTMAEHSLNRMGTDFWGNPKATATPVEKKETNESQTTKEPVVINSSQTQSQTKTIPFKVETTSSPPKPKVEPPNSTRLKAPIPISQPE